MLPLLIGLGGLGILALAMKSSTAKAKQETQTKSSTALAKSEPAIDLRMYARGLLNYVNRGGKKMTTIRKYQGKIGAKRTGIPDSQTEKKVEAILGYDVSWKPTKKRVPAKVFTRKKARVSPVRRTKAKAKPVSKKPSGPLEAILESLAKQKPMADTAPPKRAQTEKPKLLPATTRLPKFTQIPKALPDSVVAASSLDAYLRNGGMDRTRIKDYQRRMGTLSIDGIPGPKTKARAESLLSRVVSWPANNAAEDLRLYYRQGNRNRTKIKAFQNAMGELTVDGLVGPATKRRYKQLTGKNF